ncbi:hypothetical protein TIFTF001_034577 [Ficus carica]|uniref:DUF8039 domain-containing protein n=1 Tax=Ficus carica TaxID=3494 RepID=A0AA88E027_FICCA|nr:hypothetical protein TIFTF001_034577 [Ficus carica]
MAEETNVPTVDQHNSLKASCTMNEKEAGPLDPKPMPNANKECQLFLPDLVNRGDVLVAIGRAYMECVPTDTVHGIPLGEENVRVTIIVPKLKCALLPILTNEATCIEEAVGGFIAWLKRLVVVETSLSQASQGPSHAPDREAVGSKRTKKRAWRKKIQSQPEILSGLLCKNRALNDWKLLVGRGIRQQCNCQTLIDTVRCPILEGYVECGYFVLAFIREITLTVNGLGVLQTKDFYTDADMSLVRQEWATFVMRFIQY